MFELKGRGEPLFTKGSLSDVIARHEQVLVETVNQKIQPENLESFGEDELIHEMEEKFKLTAPKIFPEERKREPATEGTITIIVPFEGDPELFYYHPNPMTVDYPNVEIQGNELKFSYPTEQIDGAGIKSRNDQTIESLTRNLISAENQVAGFNASIPGKVQNCIEARKGKLKQEKELHDNIGIPIREESG